MSRVASPRPGRRARRWLAADRRRAAAGAGADVNSYYVFVLANVALLAIVGIGLNVLLGLTGQVSFGHVGFYAIGAYTVGILTTKAALELLAGLAARPRCSPARSARCSRCRRCA